jgi:hypothetical protein
MAIGGKFEGITINLHLTDHRCSVSFDAMEGQTFRRGAKGVGHLTGVVETASAFE